MAEEYYRQEIVIDVNDKGVVTRIKAMEDRIDKTFNRIEKHGKALSRQRFNPVLELRDRLTDKADKAQRMLNQLQHTKVTPLVELRGKIENELKHIQSTLKEINNEYVEPKIRLRDRATPILRNIVEKLGSLSGKTVHVAVKASTVPLRAIGSVATNPWALAATGAAVGYGGIFKPLQLAGQQEQAQIGFSTLLGSDKKANVLLKQLQGFANNTPFDYAQVRDQAKKMLAFGFKDKSLVPMMTSIGNASAGLGLGPEGMERIVTALGQMKAKSKVQSDEMLQLTEAGIPAWDILSKKMGKSTAQVMKLTEKGLIPADKAINALIDGMNKRFPNMLEKQSHSLFGLFDTIKDTFNNSILEKWGEGLESSIEPRFEKIKEWINDNGDTIKRWGATLKHIAGQASDWLLTKFENAFSYITSHYIDNPKFKNLSFSGKINFVFNDLMDVFDSWFAKTGKSELDKICSEIVDSMITGFEAAGPRFAKAGVNIGLAMGLGIEKGLMDSIQKNKILKVIFAADPSSKVLPAGFKLYDDIKTDGLKAGLNDVVKSLFPSPPKSHKSTKSVGSTPPINMIGAVPAHAIGGIFNQPHYGVFAEDGAESLIPLNPRLRDRALGIWSKTGEMLGIKSDSEKSSSSGSHVTVQMNGPLIGAVHVGETGDIEEQAKSFAMTFAHELGSHLGNLA